MANENLIELSGVWINEAKGSGKKYMGGRLRKGLTLVLESGEILGEGSRLLIFKNEKREGKKDPDYRLFVARPDERDQAAASPRPTSNPNAGPSVPDDDSTPF